MPQEVRQTTTLRRVPVSGGISLDFLLSVDGTTSTYSVQVPSTLEKEGKIQELKKYNQRVIISFIHMQKEHGSARGDQLCTY